LIEWTKFQAEWIPKLNRILLLFPIPTWLYLEVIVSSMEIMVYLSIDDCPFSEHRGFFCIIRA